MANRQHSHRPYMRPRFVVDPDSSGDGHLVWDYGGVAGRRIKCRCAREEDARDIAAVLNERERFDQEDEEMEGLRFK